MKIQIIALVSLVSTACSSTPRTFDIQRALASNVGETESTANRSKCESNSTIKYLFSKLEGFMRIDSQSSEFHNIANVISEQGYEAAPEFNKVIESLPQYYSKQRAHWLSIIASSISGRPKTVMRMRQCKTKKATEMLAWIVRSQDYSSQRNGAYILAGTVHNSNICTVLHHLYDPSISISGQSNLLSAVKVVSWYAYKENVAAIKKALEVVKARIQPDLYKDERLRDQNKLIAEILQSVEKSPDKNKRLPRYLRKYCVNYNYSKPLTNWGI